MVRSSSLISTAGSSRKRPFTGMGRMNNIDIAYGLLLGGELVDIALSAPETRGSKIRAFTPAGDESRLTTVASDLRRERRMIARQWGWRFTPGHGRRHLRDRRPQSSGPPGDISGSTSSKTPAMETSMATKVREFGTYVASMRSRPSRSMITLDTSITPMRRIGHSQISCRPGRSWRGIELHSEPFSGLRDSLGQRRNFDLQDQ